MYKRKRKKDVTFEPDMEITELADGGAEIGPAGDAPIDQSQIPFDANLAGYSLDMLCGCSCADPIVEGCTNAHCTQRRTETHSAPLAARIKCSSVTNPCSSCVQAVCTHFVHTGRRGPDTRTKRRTATTESGTQHRQPFTLVLLKH